jgi:hypothetical protein
MPDTVYEIPVWMTEHLLDALGGRENVLLLMSGRREQPWTNYPLSLAQRDMEGKIALLQKLHDESLLDEGEGVG